MHLRKWQNSIHRIRANMIVEMRQGALIPCMSVCVAKAYKDTSKRVTTQVSLMP